MSRPIGVTLIAASIPGFSRLTLHRALTRPAAHHGRGFLIVSVLPSLLALLAAHALSLDPGTQTARGSPHDPRLVAIPAPDGGTIQADRYGTGDRGVILAHGGRFDRTSWEKQARALADAGFRVVAIDFRAAVEARSGRQTACLYDASCLAADVLAAVRHLRREGATSVSVVGGSLGGGGAAQAAVEAGEGEIDRVVLLAPMPIERPERMKGRKLFVVTRDDVGPGGKPRLPGIREQYEKCPGPKELLVLEGSAHAQFIFESPEGARLMREILRFLTAP
jgi:dienelactone hydrolase